MLNRFVEVSRVPLPLTARRRYVGSGGLYLLRHCWMWWHNWMAPAGQSLFFLVADDEERAVLMFRLIWIASVHARYFLRRYMPTNILLDALRTRRGPKWGVPAMLLAVPYLYVGYLLSGLIEAGGPGGLHLLVLLCVWNAMKMTFMGPVSIVLLVRARAREYRIRRRARQMLPAAV